MARRMTPSQFRSEMNRRIGKYNQAVRRYNDAVKRVQRAQKAAYQNAVNDYNRRVREYNSKVGRAISAYNDQVRAHNAQVNRFRDQLKYRVSALRDRSVSSELSVVRQTTYRLYESYERLDAQTETLARNGLMAIVDQESGNSVDVFNFLSGGENRSDAELELESADDAPVLEFLNGISGDLLNRWKGAIFSLNPQNPDAARHFCASVREIFRDLLDLFAPDSDVLEDDPSCEVSQFGTPTRRSKIIYLLRGKGVLSNELTEFVERDIANIIEMFNVFNKATHGPAGTHGLSSLKVLRKRVSGGIMFLANLAV